MSVDDLKIALQMANQILPIHIIVVSIVVVIAISLIMPIAKALDGLIDTFAPTKTSAEKYLYSISLREFPRTKIYPFQQYHRNWYVRYFFVEVKQCTDP